MKKTNLLLSFAAVASLAMMTAAVGCSSDSAAKTDEASAEKSCGGDKAAAEGDKAEKSCGGDKAEKSCGGDKAAAGDDKKAEGSCGEGSCGGN